MDFKEKIEGKNRYSFCIGYKGSEENASTHNRFKKFAEQYDDVYISALRVLLDNYEQRNEYDCILGLIDELEKQYSIIEAEVEELKKEASAKKEKKVLKTFGKEE